MLCLPRNVEITPGNNIFWKRSKGTITGGQLEFVNRDDTKHGRNISVGNYLYE